MTPDLPEGIHRTPPPIKQKPRRVKSVDYGLKGEDEEETRQEGRKLPVGATAQIGQLASVMKMGVTTAPFKPRVSHIAT